MRRLPAGGVKIRRVEPRHVHDLVERPEDAFLDELAHPGQVDRDDVIGALLALGVAQRLDTQPVDGKGALMDRRADDLFELALEVFHHHEGRIAVHENAYAARKLERFGQHLDRRDGARGHVRAAEIVVPRLSRLP